MSREVVAFSLNQELAEWLNGYAKKQNVKKSYIVRKLLELIKHKDMNRGI